MPPASRKLLRAINRSQVLNTIRAEGPISRVDISRLTGLSQPTVTSISAAMLDGGIILEKQVGNSTGGRPPILLDLNLESLYVIGIKLTESQISAALTNVRADVIGNYRLNSTETQRTVDWAVDFVEEAVNLSIQESGIERRQLAGVGIGMAGVIDINTGACRYSPFFHWQNVPFRELVQERLGIPTYVDNDVNTLAMAEQWFGDGKGVDNFLVITLGRGVGMGIVLNGQFYRGTKGGAGEFGHTVVDINGPQCDCGKRGCLEAYVSDHALEGLAQDILGRPVTIEEALIEAKRNEPLRAQIAQAGMILGASVANVINLFDPTLIIITGEGTRAGDLILQPMYEAIEQHTFPGMAGDVEIVVQEWGDEAWARGAASLVLRELYKSPVQQLEPSI